VVPLLARPLASVAALGLVLSGNRTLLEGPGNDRDAEGCLAAEGDMSKPAG